MLAPVISRPHDRAGHSLASDEKIIYGGQLWPSEDGGLFLEKKKKDVTCYSWGEKCGEKDASLPHYSRSFLMTEDEKSVLHFFHSVPAEPNTLIEIKLCFDLAKVFVIDKATATNTKTKHHT